MDGTVARTVESSRSKTEATTAARPGTGLKARVGTGREAEAEAEAVGMVEGAEVSLSLTGLWGLTRRGAHRWRSLVAVAMGAMRVMLLVVVVVMVVKGGGEREREREREGEREM